MKHGFHKVGKCFGFTLWSWRKHVELWVCFEAVEPHSHPGQHVEILPLFGWAEFARVKPQSRRDAEIESAVLGCKVKDTVTQRIKISPWKWFRKFSIPAGCRHWFTLKRKPLVFLNITTGKSAAENFVTV